MERLHHSVKLITDHPHAPNFAVGFSTRVGWKIGNVLRNYDRVFSIDESEMVCGVDAGIFWDTHNVAALLGFPEFASRVDVMVYLGTCW